MTARHVEPCKAELERLAGGDVVEMAILATVDGLPVAHVANLIDEPDGVSAMSASLIAIADAMAGQFQNAGKGGCRQIVMEAGDGRVIALIHVGENMVLAAIGRPSVNLGMLLAHARQSAEKIMDIVASSHDDSGIETGRAPRGASLEDLVSRVLREAAEARKE